MCERVSGAPTAASARPPENTKSIRLHRAQGFSSFLRPLVSTVAHCVRLYPDAAALDRLGDRLVGVDRRAEGAEADALLDGDRELRDGLARVLRANHPDESSEDLDAARPVEPRGDPSRSLCANAALSVSLWPMSGSKPDRAVVGPPAELYRWQKRYPRSLPRCPSRRRRYRARRAGGFASLSRNNAVTFVVKRRARRRWRRRSLLALLIGFSSYRHVAVRLEPRPVELSGVREFTPRELSCYR